MRLTSILLLTHLLSLTAASPQLASIVSRGVPATEPGAVFNWFQKRAGELEADPEEEEEVSTGYTSISTTGSNAWMPPGPNDKFVDVLPPPSLLWL